MELIACADRARFKLPLTGSAGVSGISSFYKNTITRVSVFLHYSYCSHQESNQNEISIIYNVHFTVHLTAPTF